jgi:hypothetical protein
MVISRLYGRNCDKILNMWEHTTRIVTLGNGDAHAVLREMKAEGWEFKAYEPNPESQTNSQYLCTFTRPKQ